MNKKIKTLVGMALFTAIVVVLQVVFGKVTVGPAALNPVLVPVVVGAAVYGWGAGAWLGFVSGMAILLTGAAEPFFGAMPLETVLVVLLKGTMSGLLAGAVYKLLAKVNMWLAVIVAAITCPVVNTGIFLIGCRVFFWEQFVMPWAEGSQWANPVVYMLLGLAGINFLVELGLNLFLSPAITRLIRIGKK